MALSLKDVTPSRVADAVVSRAKYHFIHPVIGTVPRMIWGNDAGIRGNIRGELDRRRGRRAYEAASGSPAPTSTEAEELRAQGFLRIDPGYAPGAFDRVRKSYLGLLASDETSEWNGVGKFRESSRSIIDAPRNLDGLDEILTPHVRSVVEGYFGSWFDVLVVEAWRTLALAGVTEDTAVEAYSNQWHNDRYPTSWLRIFIYLSDGVTRETGAFRCHPIPSTKQIVRSGGYLRRSLMLASTRAALEDESRIVYFEGNAGDACLANAMHCLHRAGVPKAGSTRDILAFTFKPAPKPLPARWAHTVAPTLKY